MKHVIFLFFLLCNSFAQDKILIITNGDTATYHIVAKQPADTSKHIYTGFLSVDIQCTSEKWQNYKFTFDNHTNTNVDTVFIEIDSGFMKFDLIWNFSGSHYFPDLKDNQDAFNSKYVYLFFNGLHQDSCFLDVDTETGHSIDTIDFNVGFYKDGILYSKMMNIGGDIYFDPSPRLIWDENKEPDLKGYKVYHGINSKKYTGEILTDRNELKLKSNFFNHYFSVTAIDMAGNESQKSHEIKWTEAVK